MNAEPEPFLGFEGPEKKLEMEFSVPDKDSKGLRTLSQDEWQDVLNEAQCKILSRMSNEHCDSFVLSESSLFVYRHKLMLKTCGTTTLLYVIPKILEHAKVLGIHCEYVSFTRKSFNFPHAQRHPHRTIEDEVAYLDNYFSGQAYILGPLKGDHFLVYLWDSGVHTHDASATLEIMMHDLDRTKMAQFYQDADHNGDVKLLTRSSGIDQLIPGSSIDATLFTPMGYSMNGLLDETLSTIHITPEEQCSFVSYETTFRPQNGYVDLINNVVATFMPKRFTLTLFADEHALPAGVVSTMHAFEKRQLPGYRMTSRTFHEFDGSYDVTMCNYVKIDA